MIHSFLGPIGGPELILIGVVLALLLLPAVVVVLVITLVNRNKLPPHPVSSPPPPPLPAVTAHARLEEIDSLKARGLISGTEHEEQRKKIISGI